MLHFCGLKLFINQQRLQAARWNIFISNSTLFLIIKLINNVRAEMSIKLEKDIHSNNHQYFLVATML